MAQSLSAAAQKIYVKNETEIAYTEPLFLKPGTYITGVKVFANGQKIRDVKRLVRTYTLPDDKLTTADDWEKVRGTAIVTNGKMERKGEIYWYQHKDIGQVEWKLKKFLDRGGEDES